MDNIDKVEDAVDESAVVKETDSKEQEVADAVDEVMNELQDVDGDIQKLKARQQELMDLLSDPTVMRGYNKAKNNAGGNKKQVSKKEYKKKKAKRRMAKKSKK